jgi:signal transduction histidine kinase
MLGDKRILVVDDSPVVRGFLRKLLTVGGARVDEAAGGQEGLARARAGTPYDLILLDLAMPDMDGIEVLRQIRIENDTTAIVMVTGVGGVKSAVAAVREGADGYIEKQDISASDDRIEFQFALEQAITQRAGLVAQRQLQELKTDFYSMITHDLRNPAAALQIAVTMLLAGDAGPISDAQRELLHHAENSVARLLALINDYLDFAKIDAGYLRLEVGEAELRGIVEASARLAGIQAQSKEQGLVLDLPSEPVIATVDADRLGQVLDNLLSNAIKYTPEGGQIRVELWTDDGNAVFRVSDTGCGVPPDQLSILFAKYHRVRSGAAQDTRGTGLGLLIVKEIVEAHGGTVQAESEGAPGLGATFVVKIPLRVPES